MTNKQQQIEAAAKHFVNLYAEEIEEGENITGNMIHEWWWQTVDQYSELNNNDLNEIEAAIFEKI